MNGFIHCLRSFYFFVSLSLTLYHNAETLNVQVESIAHMRWSKKHKIKMTTTNICKLNRKHCFNPFTIHQLTDPTLRKLEFYIVCVLSNWIFEKSHLVRSNFYNWWQWQEWLHSCCKRPKHHSHLLFFCFFYCCIFLLVSFFLFVASINFPLFSLTS